MGREVNWKEAPRGWHPEKNLKLIFKLWYPQLSLITSQPETVVASWSFLHDEEATNHEIIPKIMSLQLSVVKLSSASIFGRIEQGFLFLVYEFFKAASSSFNSFFISILGPEFANHSFLYKNFLVVWITSLQRQKYYFAWKLGRHVLCLIIFR